MVIAVRCRIACGVPIEQTVLNQGVMLMCAVICDWMFQDQGQTVSSLETKRFILSLNHHEQSSDR
jgi:hypothetical protein